MAFLKVRGSQKRSVNLIQCKNGTVFFYYVGHAKDPVLPCSVHFSFLMSRAVCIVRFQAAGWPSCYGTRVDPSALEQLSKRKWLHRGAYCNLVDNFRVSSIIPASSCSSLYMTPQIQESTRCFASLLYCGCTQAWIGNVLRAPRCKQIMSNISIN